MDLRSYMDRVEAAGELGRVKSSVSPIYEIAAVTAKADGGRALLFEDVKGSSFRLVSNMVGTRSRFAMALNSAAPSIHKDVTRLIARAEKPKAALRGKFMENSTKDASKLPIVTHFEKEPGPFITSSMIHAGGAETGQNSSFHRMMPIGGPRFSVRMVEGRHLHRLFTDAKERGEDLRAAVTIGVHPAVSIAGAYQAEFGFDEMHIANAFLGGSLTVAKCPYSDAAVPSDAEIVMDGRFLQDETHEEWMVEMLRTYDHKRRQPIFEADRLYYRNDPIFHDILSGFAEHRLLMGMPIESKMNHQLKAKFPHVRGAAMTDGGCDWLHAVVQIRKEADSQPRSIIDEALKIHRSLKQVTIVDEDIDANSADAVEYAMATRFQADRDLVIVRNVRGSSLDPSSDQENLQTAKMGIDATMPLAKRPEGFEIAKIPGLDGTVLGDYLDAGTEPGKTKNSRQV